MLILSRMSFAWVEYCTVVTHLGADSTLSLGYSLLFTEKIARLEKL